MSRTRPIAWLYANHLLDADHDTGIDTWLTEQRSNGDSYESIARNLYVLTDQKIEVTGRTIANWVSSIKEDA